MKSCLELQTQGTGIVTCRHPATYASSVCTILSAPWTCHGHVDRDRWKGMNVDERPELRPATTPNTELLTRDVTLRQTYDNLPTRRRETRYKYRQVRRARPKVVALAWHRYCDGHEMGQFKMVPYYALCYNVRMNHNSRSTSIPQTLAATRTTADSSPTRRMSSAMSQKEVLV